MSAEKDSSPAEGIVRSAGVVSVAVMTSRVTGLVREMVMAHLFGASQAMDAFRLAFLLPNLTRDLFAEGAFSSAFVTTFTGVLAKSGKAEAEKLFRLVATAVLVVVGGLCVLGIVLAPWLVEMIAPGFHRSPGKFELAVHLTRIQFPFLLQVALAALVMGVLNANNQFGVPAMASTFFNIGSIGFGLLVGFTAAPLLGTSPIEGMAWGVVLGGLLQLTWQLPSLYRTGFSYRPRMDWQDPGLRRVVLLMGPAVVGTAAVQINVMVNTNFATYIVDPFRGPNGPVSWLGWAFRFMQLPLGLFGVALGSAMLPAVSRSLALGATDEFRRTLSRSLGVVLLLTVPSSIGLIVLGKHMIAAVYQSGKVNAYDTAQTALALSCYAVGLAGYAGIKILAPAFYAMHDSRTPMLVSLASIAVNLGTAVLSLRYTQLGHAGLALATSVVALFNFVALFWILRNRAGGIYGRDLASSVSRIGLASVAMGALISGLESVLDGRMGAGRTGALGTLAVCIPAGVVSYALMCRLLRLPEWTLAANAFARPLRRVFAGRP